MGPLGQGLASATATACCLTAVSTSVLVGRRGDDRIAVRAPSFTAWLSVAYTKIRRPKSTMPNNRRMRMGAISANSTIPCERCLSRGRRIESLISVATDRHMRVGDDVDRIAQHALQKTRRETEAHDQDHVHVGALVAVVGRR